MGKQVLYYIGRFIAWAIAVIFGRLRVIGAECIPRTGGVVLAANHTSYLDPPLVGVVAGRPTWFMGKSELFDVPVLGWLLWRVHAFPVKRGTADRQALRRAHELLTEGKALNIFPEGARSPDGRLQPPEAGTSLIAIRAGVPVVPIAIINADRLLLRHGGLRFTRLTVVIGAPLTFPHLAGKSPDRAALREVSDAVMCRIAELLREHGAPERVPEGYLKAAGGTEEPAP